MKGMNINLNGGSPGERIMMGLFVVAVLIDLADITWVRPVEATPMTHELGLEVCGERQIKRLEGWAVECFTKQDQPEPAATSMPWHMLEHPPEGWRCTGDSVGGGNFRCYEESPKAP